MLNKSSGVVQSADYTGGKVVINIPDGCSGITLGVRSLVPIDDPPFTDGVYVNVDQMHEDTENGFALFKGKTQEFRMHNDSIRKLTLTAMDASNLPVVDFAVTERSKSES